MSVNNFDPRSQPPVTATEAAREHLRRQMARSERPGLRLGIKESGCNGYMYTLDYIDGPEDDDRPYDIGASLTVYVRDSDLALVRGTEVDYVTEGLNASLKFKNPNASTYCGCGESFAVAEGHAVAEGQAPADST